MANETKVELLTPALLVRIGEKEYHISFDDELGIFISSNQGLEVTNASKTGNWLYIK